MATQCDMLLETEVNMAVLHVRNVPNDLYALAQSIADERGSTLSALVIELMEQAAERHMARKKHARVLARMRRDLSKRKQTAVSGADLVQAFRDERDSARD